MTDLVKRLREEAYPCYCEEAADRIEELENGFLTVANHINVIKTQRRHEDFNLDQKLSKLFELCLVNFRGRAALEGKD